MSDQTTRHKMAELLAGPGPSQADHLMSEKSAFAEPQRMLWPFRKDPYTGDMGFGHSAITQSLANGFTAPSRAMAGQIPQWEEQPDGSVRTSTAMNAAGNDLAGLAMVSGMAMPKPLNSVGSAGGGQMKPHPHAPMRDLDSLGFYSQALESAKTWNQAKGTPEQAIAWLKKSGVKDSEIDATRVAKAFEGQSSVARDDLVKHLTDNRVRLDEVVRSNAADARNAKAVEMYGSPFESLSRPGDRLRVEAELQKSLGGDFSTKYSTNSLDPNNPTYQETVLHLPKDGSPLTFERFRYAISKNGTEDAKELWDKHTPAARQEYFDQNSARHFGSTHFPEHDVTGHTMTSLNKHEGRLVYNLDQIQADWAQKIREGGVRDEARTAALESQAAAAFTRRSAARDALDKELGPRQPQKKMSIDDIMAELETPMTKKQTPVQREWEIADTEWRRLDAEYKTAKASASGHPLVNTTDQWTTTTLRRALQKAAEAEADHIAIPSGDTVLSYNPGDTHGMNAFYNDIVPKNLANILKKLDKSGLKRSYVDQLETPTSGMAGKGFSLFDLTPKMREEIRRGLPLFSNPAQGAGVGGLAAQLTPEQQREYLAGRLF